MKSRHHSEVAKLSSSRPVRLFIVRSAVALFCLLALGASLTIWHGLIRSAVAAPVQDHQTSPDELWQDIDKTTLMARQGKCDPPPPNPFHHRAVHLRQEKLARTLKQAPLATADPAERASKDEIRMVMTLPLPDGTFSRFRVEESPVLEPKLAARFPTIKTYQGRGMDDPTATMQFDVTPLGFHAMILSSRHDTVYIDPYASGADGSYISYYKHDSPTNGAPFECQTSTATSALLPSLAPSATPGISDGKLRIYRLAIAATSAFTKYSAPARDCEEPKGTVETAMAAITTLVSRINGIYKRDLAIAFELVGPEVDDEAHRIIFDDPATDPFYDVAAGVYLLGNAITDKNQETLNARIGAANYQVGHVLHYGTPSGQAAVGVICNEGDKARGVTLQSVISRGDIQAMIVFAHELGHQFGAQHTFNAEDGSLNSEGHHTNACNPDNRKGGTAYEPGSGSTIMSYGGICQPHDFQAGGDQYFHIASIEQIRAHISNNSCAYRSPEEADPNKINFAVISDIGKPAPEVTTAASIITPRGTPFTLTAKGNESALDYCWEEYDLGAGSYQTLPDTDADGERPIFRSYPPEQNPTRTFPRLDSLLSGAPNLGESLPMISRTMTFKVTARDNNLNGGGVGVATQTVFVDATAGPLVVTQPEKGTLLEGGSMQTVNWDVARTDTLAGQVSILLSTDGGRTFDRTLSTCTPNDGRKSVSLPNIAAADARVKVVACSGSTTFFNISGSFATCAKPRITAQPVATVACAGQAVVLSVTAAGENLHYQWYRNGVAITAETISTLSIPSVASANAGSYYVEVSNGCGPPVNSSPANLTVNGAATISPTSLTLDAGAGSSSVNVRASCSWAAVSNAPWLTITSPTNGSGNGVLNYHLDANPGAARTGTMTIAGQTFTVKQAAASSAEQNDSRFIIQSLPPALAAGQMTPGQTGTVSITMKNTGKSNWTQAGGYSLVSQAPVLNLNWRVHAVAVPALGVAPGSEVTFSFNIKAPATPGVYRFEWRMMQGEWGFGDFSPAIYITVK